MLNVLVIGSGGRENALAYKISKSPLLKNLYAIPGNPGFLNYAKCFNYDPNNFELIKNFCLEKTIDLVVVGPEAFLAKGIADYLRENNIKVFGPNKASAKIESSKIFAKNLMKKLNVPTAHFQVFTAEEREAIFDFLNKQEYPVVIKADGLAAGKGVIIAKDLNEAKETIIEFFDNNKFGDAGKRVVIEEFLTGEEVSLFALTDGENYLLLNPAQDYKKIYDKDLGKNTGGMGSFSFRSILTDEQISEIENNIIKPILKGLREENIRFNGCLYCGLILTEDGIKVIEFNCRFGDPETQAVLLTLEDDLLEIMYQIADFNLMKRKVENKGSAICLVLASDGYPDTFKTGYLISGLDKDFGDEIKIFHSGTKLDNNEILTAGGRVLNIVAYSKEKRFDELIPLVYKVADEIQFENKYFRKDIGLKGIPKFKMDD